MRDPHVVSLLYRLVPNASTRSFHGPPVNWNTDVFRARLADGFLTVEMVEHFPTAEVARNAVEPHLRSWEVYDALRRKGRQAFHLDFESPAVIDRNPPLTPDISINVVAIGRVESTFHATHRYPDPPGQFTLSPDAETLWHRYQLFLNGREPLASMGYACLTWLEAVDGGSTNLAKKYNISRNVLRTLRRLTSQVGDPPRKYMAGQNPRAYTGDEAAWIEAVIRELILRVGQWAVDPNRDLPELTMANPPKLPL